MPRKTLPAGEANKFVDFSFNEAAAHAAENHANGIEGCGLVAFTLQ